MNSYCCYENRSNRIINLKRYRTIPFFHIWQVYNLESLRYLQKTNRKLTNRKLLYTKICKFISSLESRHKEENWVVIPKKKKITTKKLQLVKKLRFKISKTQTKVNYKEVMFQKQIYWNNIPIEPFLKYTNLSSDYITLNEFLKSQLNNEKI